jgi:hypothetical protein
MVEHDEEVSNLPARVEEQLPAMVEAEKSRAVQEVQAALVMAKRFPRDTERAFTRIMQDCKRLSLAKIALYRFPRAGQSIEGPSIRLAESMARSYGNLSFGVKELERRKGCSVMEAFCWDMENNVSSRIAFEVPHEIGLKGGRTKRLSDPRDIYELTANNGARRLRKCILEIIPGDIVEAAVAQCRKTVAAGDGKETLQDRVRKMVLAFTEIGVSQEMLEERLQHKVDLTTGEEIVDLVGIFNAIKDKTAKRRDFFNFPETDEAGGLAAEFRDQLQANKQPKEASDE